MFGKVEDKGYAPGDCRPLKRQHDTLELEVTRSDFTSHDEINCELFNQFLRALSNDS